MLTKTIGKFLRNRDVMKTRSLASFLDSVKANDLAICLDDGERPSISIDRPLNGRGLCLDKKTTDNPLGRKCPSVFRLVRLMAFPLRLPELKGVTGLADLFARMNLIVDDASPDSVASLIFLAARQSGVAVPADLYDAWDEAVTDWEVNGTVEQPEVSWPALASALAHTLYGGRPEAEGSKEAISLAWRRVVAFAVETLRQDLDPRAIPPEAAGRFLQAARAALDEEQARYERKVLAQGIHQLSLPMRGSDRRRLVDALFTREDEFSGAMKVYARNDRENAPLGRGFSVMMLERPEARVKDPMFWMTVSVDTRRNIHLRDLWRELEARETAAWEKAGKDRPRGQTEGSGASRNGADGDRRPFLKQWYLDEEASLVASPRRQTDREESASDEYIPVSLLETADVVDALYTLYDPFQQDPVRTAPDGPEIRLIDAKQRRLEGGKRVLKAWWPPHNPLPNPSGAAPRGGLFPTAVRAMAARTLGLPPEKALQFAPDIEDVDIVPAGNALAVITDGGVFLLDSGRRGPDLIERAERLVEFQAVVARKLDDIQRRVEERAKLQEQEIGWRGSRGAWLDHQRLCTELHSQLIHLRGALEKPLETKAAMLGDLKAAISHRWNIQDRLQELASEIAWLRENGRAIEELRTFRKVRIAGGAAVAIVVADALTTRLATLLRAEAPEDWMASSPLLEAPTLELLVFLSLSAITGLALILLEALLRTRPVRR